MSHEPDDEDDMVADVEEEEQLRQALAAKEERPRIQYGSLELQARATSTQPTADQSSSSADALVISQSTLNASMQAGRSIAASSSPPPPSSSSLLDAGRAAGHINIAAADSGQYELSESSRIEHDKQAAVLRDMELRKRARSIAIPTNDTQVRRRLRELSQPITLFGERQPGRRERLGIVLAKLAMEDRGVDAQEEQKQDDDKGRRQEQKAFLEPGPDSLRASRAAILPFTLDAARRRLEKEKAAAAQSRLFVPHPSLSQYAAVASTLGDGRPLSSVAFSPSSELLATASWSGLCKVWTVGGCAERLVLRGHSFNATDVAWHPQAERAQSAASVNLASCGMDGQVLLWPLQAAAANDVDMTAPESASLSSSSSSPAVTETPSTAPLAILHPHSERCSRLAFHPSGLHLYTASYDLTFQLHDLTTQQCLLSQPGHLYPVYSLSLHPDGSLLLTGDLGGVAHLWDVRTGRAVRSLLGHARAVLCSDWSAEGWLVATGGGDNAVRVWDIRSVRDLYTLPAHSRLVSGVRWMRGVWGGQEAAERVTDCLVTCGHDGLLRLWDAHTMSLLRELRGHEKLIMKLDVANTALSDGMPAIASASYDRTWKLWNVPD